jgi:hypothetical protein
MLVRVWRTVWEPNVSVGMEREPKLTTIYNVAGYQT